MANRRRSAYVGFSVLTLSAAGLAGCDDQQPKVYSSLDQCRTDHPGQACDSAWQASVGEHDRTAPRYTRKEECEAQYGPGHCESRKGGVFMPMMAGFVLGQMLSNNNNYGGGYRGGYVGHPVFFSRSGGYQAPGIRSGESFFTRSGGTSRGGFGATAGFRGAFGGFRGG